MSWTLKASQEPPIGKEVLWCTNLGNMVLATKYGYSNALGVYTQYHPNTHFMVGFDCETAIESDTEYLYAWRDKPELPELPVESKTPHKVAFLTTKRIK